MIVSAGPIGVFFSFGSREATVGPFSFGEGMTYTVSSSDEIMFRTARDIAWSADAVFLIDWVV